MEKRTWPVTNEPLTTEHLLNFYDKVIARVRTEVHKLVRLQEAAQSSDEYEYYGSYNHAVS